MQMNYVGEQKSGYCLLDQVTLPDQWDKLSHHHKNSCQSLLFLIETSDQVANITKPCQQILTTSCACTMNFQQI